MAINEIGLRLRLEGAAALRVFNQLRDQIGQLVKAQERLNNIRGVSRNRIADIEAEIRARRELLDTLQQEVRNRSFSASAALDKETRAQRERIRLLEDEVNSRRDAQRRIAEVGRNRVDQARSDVDRAQADSRKQVQSAQFVSGVIVKSARDRNRAEVESSQATVKAAEDRLKAMRKEAIGAAAEQKKMVDDARRHVRDLQNTRTAKGGLSPTTQAKLKTAQEQLGVIEGAAVSSAQERKAILALEEERVRQIRERSKVEVRASNETLQRILANEQAKIETIKATTQAAIDGAQRQLAAARRSATRGDTGAVAEVVKAQRALNVARRNQADQIDRVRRDGQRLVAEAQREVTSTRQIINALNRKAQALRATARAHNLYARSLATTNRALTGSFRNITGFTARITALVLAYGGFRRLTGLIATGLRFNQMIESSTLGIASLITAEARLRTADGQLLEGREALTAATGLAEDQLRKLRIAGILTSATTEELVTSFQEAVGAGISVGLTLDQIRKFTVSVAQAATTIHLPFNQLNQEVRSILQGTIDRNSRIAKALQLTNEEVRLAKEQGRLYELLTERFAAFNVAGEVAVNTWSALGSNIKDAIQLLAGEATAPFFEQVRDAGLEALSTIFDLSSASIQQGFRGLVIGFAEFFDEMGSAFADGIEAAVSGARSLSEWLVKNRDAVHETVVAFGTMVREIAGLVGDLIGAADETGRWATETNTLVTVFRSISGLVRFFRDNINIIKTIIVGMAASGLVTIAIANPIAAAVIAAASLVGFLNRAAAAQKAARGEWDRGNASYARQTAEVIRLGEEYISLRSKLDRLKKGSQERKDAEIELAGIRGRLVEAEALYGKVIDNTTLSAQQQADGIRALARTRTELLQQGLRGLRKQEEEGQKAIDNLEAQKKALQAHSLELTGQERDEDKISAITQEIENRKKGMTELRGSINTITEGLELTATAAEEARKKLQDVTAEPREGGGKTAAKKIADDAVQAAKARLKTEQQLNKTIQEDQENRYKAGLISAKKYYDTLEGAALRVLDRERDVANAELDLATIKGDPGEITAAREHQERVESARAEVAAEFRGKRLEDARDFAKQQRQVELEALTLGDEDDRLIAAARETEERYREALIKAFAEGDFRQVIKINTIIDTKNAEAQFAEIQRIAQENEARLARESAEIQRAFELGIITEEDSVRRMAAAWAAASIDVAGTITALQNLEPHLKNNPQFIEFLSDARDRMAELQTNARVAVDEMIKLKVALRDSINNALVDFLSNVGTEAARGKNLFREFANSVISDMRRIVSQMIASRIIQFLFGAASTATASAAGATAAGTNPNAVPGKKMGGLAGAPRRATGGGLLEGPGTPTSDSIPLLWVSRREYIQPANAMDFYGSSGLRFMEAFRQRLIPRDYINMAISGMRRLPLVTRQEHNYRRLGGSLLDVQARSAVGPARLAVDVNSRVDGQITFDQDGLARFVRGPVMGAAVVNHVANNPKTVDRAIRAGRGYRGNR